jgi:hypothetical protein
MHTTDLYGKNSSDLCISQPVQNSQSLGIDHTVAYGADQTVSGVLRTAQMNFAGSQVSSQVYRAYRRGDQYEYVSEGLQFKLTLQTEASKAFLVSVRASSSSLHFWSLTSNLGSDYASSNWIALNSSTSGWSPLSNILSSTPVTPILGFTLSRTSLVSDAFLYPGELALGEYLPGYTAVQAMPHLSIMTVPDS